MTTTKFYWIVFIFLQFIFVPHILASSLIFKNIVEKKGRLDLGSGGDGSATRVQCLPGEFAGTNGSCTACLGYGAGCSRAFECCGVENLVCYQSACAFDHSHLWSQDAAECQFNELTDLEVAIVLVATFVLCLGIFLVIKFCGPYVTKYLHEIRDRRYERQASHLTPPTIVHHNIDGSIETRPSPPFRVQASDTTDGRARVTHTSLPDFSSLSTLILAENGMVRPPPPSREHSGLTVPSVPPTPFFEPTDTGEVYSPPPYVQPAVTEVAYPPPAYIRPADTWAHDLPPAYDDLSLAAVSPPPHYGQILTPAGGEASIAFIFPALAVTSEDHDHEAQHPLDLTDLSQPSLHHLDPYHPSQRY